MSGNEPSSATPSSSDFLKVSNAVAPSELSNWMQEHGAKPPAAFRLVDVREVDEYEICHLDGAELIPLSGFAEQALNLLPDKQETIVLYCHHGMRSQRAAMWLRHQGFEHVVNLTGGIDAWAEQVEPTMARY